MNKIRFFILTATDMKHLQFHSLGQKKIKRKISNLKENLNLKLLQNECVVNSKV